MKFPFGTFNPTSLQTTAAAPPFPCEHFVVLLLSFYSYFYILQIHPNKHLGNSMRVHLITNLRLTFVSSSSQVGDWAECHISLLHKLPARYRFITAPDTAGPATTGDPAFFATVALPMRLLGETKTILLIFFGRKTMLCWGPPSPLATICFDKRFTIEQQWQ